VDQALRSCRWSWTVTVTPTWPWSLAVHRPCPVTTCSRVTGCVATMGQAPGYRSNHFVHCPCAGRCPGLDVSDALVPRRRPDASSARLRAVHGRWRARYERQPVVPCGVPPNVVALLAAPTLAHRRPPLRMNWDRSCLWRAEGYWQVLWVKAVGCGLLRCICKEKRQDIKLNCDVKRTLSHYNVCVCVVLVTHKMSISCVRSVNLIWSGRLRSLSYIRFPSIKCA